jgi:hypothetical protein
MSLQRPDDAVAYLLEGFKQIGYSIKSAKAPTIDVVEVCRPDTGALILRKERRKTTYGGNGPWEITYGQPVPGRKDVEVLELAASKNPVFFRQDEPGMWSWRFRQMPWPAPNYEVDVDTVKNQIVVRTKNKKYFKRIDAPNGEKMDKSELTWNWAYETLVVQHNKPARVVSQDKADQAWRLSVPVRTEGDNECGTQ